MKYYERVYFTFTNAIMQQEIEQEMGNIKGGVIYEKMGDASLQQKSFFFICYKDK
jgi:hypothetical protein